MVSGLVFLVFWFCGGLLWVRWDGDGDGGDGWWWVGGLYRNGFQPWTKPSRFISPIVGTDNSVRTTRQATSSSLTPRSVRYRIDPSMPIVSGSLIGSSSISIVSHLYRLWLMGARMTSVSIKQFIERSNRAIWTCIARFAVEESVVLIFFWLAVSCRFVLE